MDPAPLLASLIRAAGKGPDAVLAELDAPLRALGFTARPTRETPRAVLWTRGASPRLLLSGHVDVVPAGEGWERDAHGGEIAEGQVWGRGACDMLGSIACFVAAAAERPDAPVAMLFTTDEETTMHAAEIALREGLLAGIESVVVGEPTSMEVGIAEKGVLWLEILARGRNAHGSMPHLGDNAAERIVRALHAMRSVKLSGEHPILGQPTMNLGTLHSGEAVNQVPASARAEMDIRYLPGAAAKDIMASLRRATDEPVEVAIHSHHLPFELSPDAPLARSAVAAAGTRAIGLPYGTEASKFAPAGLACVILGPGEAGLAHTCRESIALTDLARGVTAYATLIGDHA